MKNRVFILRLRFALSGLRVATREKSFRTHLICTTLALSALLVLRPALIWWALVGIMCTLVLAAELFNTALEHLCDHLHPEAHPRIARVKDLAAGAVLLLSLGALWTAALMAASVFHNG